MTRAVATAVGDCRDAAGQRAALMTRLREVTDADRVGLIIGQGVRPEVSGPRLTILLDGVDDAARAAADAYRGRYRAAMNGFDERRHNPLICRFLLTPRPQVDTAWAALRERDGRDPRFERFGAWMEHEAVGDLASSTVRLAPPSAVPGRPWPAAGILGLSLHRCGPGRLTRRQRLLLRLATAEAYGHLLRGTLAMPEFAPTAHDRATALPPRRRAVLDALLAGHAPKHIARALGVSVHTVREHMRTLYRDFNVHGRDELVARFIDRGPPR